LAGDRRAGDPAVLISDAAKARDGLGWQPRKADLDEIIRTAWAWHQKGPSVLRDLTTRSSAA
jgi:UDP-glucose 4-epimerase